MDKILILYNYNNFFAGKFIGTKEKHHLVSMDVVHIKELFEKNNFHVEIKEYAEVDYDKEYSGWYIIYSSSEDLGGFYKDYIEDVLLLLQSKGAILVPKFIFFKAHSNKSLQEMLRKNFSFATLRHPQGISIGNYEELNRIADKIKCPAVIKISDGSGSRGVALAKNFDEIQLIAKKFMIHKYYDFSLNLYRRCGLFVKRLSRIVLGNKLNEKIVKTIATKKIVIEEYIEGLSGDYKVLYFGGKYFVLFRKNRDNDFRASGSGKFTYPVNLESLKKVLELAKTATQELEMPLLSLDIGENKRAAFLLEFQCLYFGPYTVQYAPCCFEFKNNQWIKTDGSFDLEEEYVRSIVQYINAKDKSR